MATLAATVLVQLLLGLLIVGAALWLLQPRLFFYPSRDLQRTPAHWGLAHEEVVLQTDDGVRLHGWLVTPPRPRASPPRAVLFLHGNAGNISHRGDSITIFASMGLSVLIFDYRGYGLSAGSPSERGLYKDADAAWAWLTGDAGLAADDIVIFGRSLGAAVAAQLAARVTPAALILESGLDRARTLARAHYPLLADLLPLRYRFPAADHAASVTCPVLVLHSPDDEIIPYRLGRRLYDAIPGPKRFVELEGGHNDGFLRSQPRYQRTLEAFLDGLARGGSKP